MLLRLDGTPIIYIIIYLITVLVISLTVHEAAHAWMALRLGDDTPKKMGRVSLNPLAHLDPIGSLMILFVGVGWGKPVQIDATKLRPNPKVGMALVAMAGPFSNLVMATIGALILRTHFLTFTPQKFFTFAGENYYFSPGFFVETFVLLNLGLMLFNLIPLAPLDGSRLWQILLPDKIYWQYARIEIFAAFLVIGLVLADLYLNNGQAISGILTRPICGLWRVMVGFGTPDMCLQMA
ncbi:MAG: site-2 protease family protein [Anaerolineae bacterium]|nr:site-2 protease family protein [Anaerolineae bacterium]